VKRASFYGESESLGTAVTPFATSGWPSADPSYVFCN